MRLFSCTFLGLLVFSAAANAQGQTYVDEFNPYYPSRTSPRLSTPQWIGEPGVEAAVILAIDDLRDPKRYEAFLRPILRRLKQIDGRAALSIMTNEVDPRDPQLQTWLKEGVSLECHTIDHPCPFFKGGFAKSKSTYDRCVDLMHDISGNKPVAFRMPCCDSLNTPSPRFWAEIFDKRTATGNVLTLDSSVFNLFTANDPELPRSLVLNPDGTERFRRYLPLDRSFVNTIEDYPYPYRIGRQCWEFPCVTPSDWQAFHQQGPYNPRTVDDMKAALDCTVLKKGVFCLVFHPHGWIRNDQVVDLIDHAVKTHGSKVKFLSFREAQERLSKSVPVPGIMPRAIDGMILRMTGGVRLTIDRNGGITGNTGPGGQHKLPFTLPPGALLASQNGEDTGLRFVDLDGDGNVDVIFSNESGYGIYLFKDLKTGWSRKVLAGKRSHSDALPMISRNGTNNGFFVHSGSLWWSNEDTVLLKDHVDRRAINDLLKNVEPQAMTPEASLRVTRARPGFQVELMAAEPLVQDPIAFAWGPDGKFWVVEMGDYPLGIDGKGKPGGIVKYLEDTKGAGKYDKQTIFLDRLGFPTGVLPYGKGVLVTCAPDIFYAEDTTGSGKADKKVVLYTGFGEGNQQHRVNGLVWGLDGWIYGANGESGGLVKSLKTGKAVDLRGRDFRIKPETGEIEPATGLTQYGRSRDDWGNWFGNNNSDPMYHYVLEDHYLRRNPYLIAPRPRLSISVTPGAARVYPISRTLPRFNDLDAANRFTSANSAIVYRDELFGPAFVNNTFVSEPVHNLVHREIMTPKGFTFTSRRADDEQTSEFLASRDNWFRPTMLQTGPDGALWVADMYRHVIEHPQWIPKDWQKKLDLRAGHDMGRVYRVYPVGAKPRAVPRFDKLDAASLVTALDSPNGWQRDMAQTLLVSKKDPGSIPLLREMALHHARPLARLHALCTLDGLDGLTPGLLRAALEDKHPGVRRHVVRLGEPWLNKARELAEAVCQRISDPDAQVRMQVAYSLGAWEDPRAGRVLGELAQRDGADPYLFAAVQSSLKPDNLQAALLQVLDGKAKHAYLVEPLMRLASAQKNAQAIAESLTVLSLPQEKGYGVWHFAALAGLLDGLEQRNSSLAQIASTKDARVREAAKGVAPVFAAARALAGDPQANVETRLLAVRLLARGTDHRKEDLKTLADLLSPQSPVAMQTAVVAALGHLREPEVAELLLRGWKGYAPAMRAQVLDVLLARPQWVQSVLDAIEHRQVLPFEVDTARRQRLLDSRDEEVSRRAAQLFAGGVNRDRRKVVAAYQPALALPGDAARGLKVFSKTCANCHQFAGVGTAVGPDLGSVADKSGDALLTAILDPNAAVEARYINYTAATKSGKVYSGLLASESGDSITLVGADGKSQVVLRSELEELFSTGKSVMPEGLEKEITPENMADLITFLRANMAPLQRKVIAGNEPEVVRLGAENTLWLLASNCAIYGKTLVYEEQHNNLGNWHSEDDHAVWTVQAPKAGAYAVLLQWACAENSAGNTFVLEAGSERLAGKVQSTGGWDAYRRTKVGELNLKAGEQQVTLRSTGRIQGALLDLKMIKLVPVRPAP
jgi:putative membrane-bound dehydrogenase-like protein